MQLDRKLNYTLHSYLSKNLKIGTSFKAGRNFTGTICIHHRNGGVKRKHTFIDYYRRINAFGLVYKIIKDLNYTAHIGAIIYENGLFSYIILSDNVNIGDKIYSGSKTSFKGKLKKGYAIPMNFINLFTIVNNVENKPFTGSIMARSAGASCLLVGKKRKW